MLTFTDGVQIDTSGPLRILTLADGMYVVGQGYCVPVRDQAAAERAIKNLK